MTPRFTNCYCSNSLRTYIETLRHFNIGFPAGAQSSYLWDIFVSKLGRVLVFAPLKLMFSDAISYVLAQCSKPQMRRVYAQWIILTRAVVAHAKAFWNRSFVVLPRVSVRQFGFSVWPEPSISLIVGGTYPNPTSIRNQNRTPKPSFFIGPTRFGTIIGFANRCPRSFAVEFFSACETLYNHLKLFLLGVQGPAVSAAGSTYFTRSSFRV